MHSVLRHLAKEQSVQQPSKERLQVTRSIICAIVVALLPPVSAGGQPAATQNSTPAAETKTPLAFIGLAFSSDGRQLAAAAGGLTTPGELTIWDVADRKLRVRRAEPTGVLAVAFSPDGAAVVIGCVDHSLKLLDTATGEVKKTFDGHQGPVRALAFSPDGRTIASGSYDKSVRLWDVDSAMLRQTLTGHTERVWSARFSPDGKVLASAGNDRQARLWNPVTGDLVRSLDHGQFTLRGVDFSPDGRWLATACGDGRARLWDVESGDIWMAIDGGGGVGGVAFAPDGRTLVLWNTEGHAVKLCRLLSDAADAADQERIGALITRLDHDSIEVRDAAGRDLLSFGMPAEPALREAMQSPSAEVRIRARRLRQAIRTPKPQDSLICEAGPIACVAISPDGLLLAAAGSAGVIELWNLASKTQVATLRP